MLGPQKLPGVVITLRVTAGALCPLRVARDGDSIDVCPVGGRVRTKGQAFHLVRFPSTPVPPSGRIPRGGRVGEGVPTQCALWGPGAPAGQLTLTTCTSAVASSPPHSRLLVTPTSALVAPSRSRTHTHVPAQRPGRALPPPGSHPGSTVHACLARWAPCALGDGAVGKDAQPGTGASCWVRARPGEEGVLDGQPLG